MNSAEQGGKRVYSGVTAGHFSAAFFTRLILIVQTNFWRTLPLALLALACSGSPTSDSKVTPPPPPAPAISLSREALSATSMAGTAATTIDVDITAGSSTALSGLAVQDASSGSAAPWLSFTLSATTGPARLTVKVDPATLGAGTYTGTLRITATGAEPRTVSVSLVVTPRPAVVLDHATLSFDAAVNGTVPSQVIAVTSANGAVSGLSLSALNCTSALNPWLTATLSATSAPATITLAVKPVGLIPATYTCTFSLTTSQALVDNAAQVISVTLVVRNVPQIAFSRDSMVIDVTAGFVVTNLGVGVSNGGSGTLNQLSVLPTVYADTAKGWLTASLDRSGAPAVLLVTASAAGRSVGRYAADVMVASGNTTVINTPAPFRVVMNVLAPAPRIIGDPLGVYLTRKFGTYQVFTASVDYTSSTSTKRFTDMVVDQIPFETTPMFVTTSFACAPDPGTNTYGTPCTLNVQAAPPSTTPVGFYTVLLYVHPRGSNSGGVYTHFGFEITP